MASDLMAKLYHGIRGWSMMFLALAEVRGGLRAAAPIPAHADGVAVKHSRNDSFDWLHDSIRQFGMLR